jgi:protein tyrosine/serine phosphatase
MINDRWRWFSIAAVVGCLFVHVSTMARTPGALQTEPRYRELPNFHQVNARLYRGAQPRPGGLQKLVSIGVNTVISLRADDSRAQAERREAAAAGLRYFNIPLARWGRPNDAKIERVLALIDTAANGVIFVHCAYGEDRTGLVIGLYRIRHDGWTSAQAIREAKHYGMRFWQRGMKDYLHDFYRDRSRGPRKQARSIDRPPRVFSGCCA